MIFQQQLRFFKKKIWRNIYIFIFAACQIAELQNCSTKCTAWCIINCSQALNSWATKISQKYNHLSDLQCQLHDTKSAKIIHHMIIQCIKGARRSNRSAIIQSTIFPV